MTKQFEYERCKYCKYHSRKKCQIGLIPVKDDLCYEKDCFLNVR